MKKRKTLVLDAVRNIINRKVAFLSIITIMMLGVGGLLCIFNLGASMRSHANTIYREHNFKDLEIVASMGISAEDVDGIKQIDGVLDAEGAYRVDCVLEANNNRIDGSIINETKRINTVSVTEGKMPSGLNECAMNQMTMKLLGVQIGDKVKVAGLSVPDLVKGNEFTITAEIMQPEYITKNEYMILLPDEAFDADAVEDRYLVAFVRADIPENVNLMSGRYKKEIISLKDRLEEYVLTLGSEHTVEIKEEANDKLTEAKEEAKEGLADAKAQLEDGEKQLEDAVREGRKELEESERKIEEGSKTLDDEVAKAEKKLRDAEAELNRQLGEAWQKILDSEAEADRQFAAAKSILDNGEGQYSDGKKQYDDGKKQYDDAVKAFADAKKQLDDAKNQIDDGEQQIKDKLSDEAWKIQEYIEIIDDLFNNVSEGLDEIEEKIPDLQNSASWTEFKALIADKDSIEDTLRNGTPEEREQCINDLLDRMEIIYQNLPSREEVRAELQKLFQKTIEKVPEKFNELKQLIEAIRKLRDAKKQYREGLAKYNEELEKANLPEAEAKLKEAEDKLNGARKELDNGWAEYYRKKAEIEKQIADAKAEYEKAKADAEKQIADGWAELNRMKREKKQEIEDGRKQISEGYETLEKTKAEKEKEIADGWNTYYEKEKEVNEQLEEAEVKVETLDDYNYVVNPRTLTASFLQLESSVSTTYAFASCFIPVFLLVASMVCFSTIAIIVDDQKKQIGAVKALGLHNHEIAFKFILFALSATVVGNVVGIGLGFLLYGIVKGPLISSYAFGRMPDKMAWIPYMVLFVGTTSMSVLISMMACNNLLKCSAIGLINGSEPVQKAMRGRKDKGSGTLYSRLIINNLRMDIKRVLVSIVVILGSCSLIGFGYTVRYAFRSSISTQTSVINNFTLQVVFDDKTIDCMDSVKKTVTENGGTYLENHYTEGLFRMPDGNEGMILLTADPDKIEPFITIKNHFGKIIPIPEDGLLIPQKMSERLKGDTDIQILDTKLYRYDVKAAGVYRNYIGAVCICDPETYEQIYGRKYEPNSLYIKLENIGAEEAQKEVLKINENLKILLPNHLMEKGDNVNKLFNMVSIICVFLSVILTFMILVNFTNILVKKRMREMLVMRINGFSLKETIGYVARESVATTVLGIIVGVIFGIVFAYVAVRFMENSHVMYVRDPYIMAWVYAILFNAGFTVLIDLISFRKIGKEPLTNIVKY